jgi:hypothetical protein
MDAVGAQAAAELEKAVGQRAAVGDRKRRDQFGEDGLRLWPTTSSSAAEWRRQ